MVFNCGPGALEWRWARFIKAGNMVAAAKAWKETATTAKGKKLPGLVRRRKEEAELAQYGRYAGVAPTVTNEPSAIPIPEPKPVEPEKPAIITQGPVPSGGWLSALLAILLSAIKGWKK